MKYLSILISQFSIQKGYTLVELLLAMSIVGVLFGLTTISLVNAQRSTSVATSEEMLIADLKSQQTKAMNGTEGGGGFGVHFDSNNTYILFNGLTYDITDPANSPVSVDDNISFSGNHTEIVFLPVNGEVKDFTAPQTITVANTAGPEQRIIEINRYGVVIQD